ncbi:PDR/VanB family oxidoreductase [Trujillonella humicola]|uniref:PDR/VanB family oxidoreductase n=1 Tax=Trujillonella humicola TaxID=3383699 RepID=UPI003906B056
MQSTHDEVELRLEVASRTIGAAGVAVLELRDPDGGELPAWTPGAHIDVRLGGDLVRQYSLCGHPTDRWSWRIAVLREPAGRGGSERVHETLVAGTPVEVSGPRNHFELKASPRYLFIAGGIGITPILPMLSAAEAAGADWELHYGGRSRQSMAFLEELADATGNRVILHPQDEVGLIDLSKILDTPRPATLVYACGPEPLLEAVEEHCRAWPGESLHMERFSPKDLGDPVRTDAFEVELARSGLTLAVPPDRSILEVLEEAGVPVLSSCQEGTCGTCETPVLDGQVDHRDSLLTPAEQSAHDTMFVCVSRAACPRLVLDL